jgi:hypothetical protein
MVLIQPEITLSALLAEKKVIIVINYTLCNEGMWSAGGITAWLLNLGTRWK